MIPILLLCVAVIVLGAVVGKPPGWIAIVLAAAALLVAVGHLKLG